MLHRRRLKTPVILDSTPWVGIEMVLGDLELIFTCLFLLCYCFHVSSTLWSPVCSQRECSLSLPTLYTNKHTLNVKFQNVKMTQHSPASWGTLGGRVHKFPNFWLPFWQPLPKTGKISCCTSYRQQQYVWLFLLIFLLPNITSLLNLAFYSSRKLGPFSF